MCLRMARITLALRRLHRFTSTATRSSGQGLCKFAFTQLVYVKKSAALSSKLIIQVYRKRVSLEFKTTAESDCAWGIEVAVEAVILHNYTATFTPCTRFPIICLPLFLSSAGTQVRGLAD